MTSAIPVQFSTNSAIKPTGCWSHSFRPEFISGFNIATAKVVCIIGMINDVSYFSPDLKYMILVFSLIKQTTNDSSL